MGIGGRGIVTLGITETFQCCILGLPLLLNEARMYWKNGDKLLLWE